MSPYKVFVNRQGRLEVVDTRDGVDTSRFIAEVTSSWKKITTIGQRRYNSINLDLSREGIYLLSYGRGPCIPVCPAKGDYIPPGYDKVSRELTDLFNRYDGRRCVERSVFKPMHGHSIVNGSLNLISNRVSIYRNRLDQHAMIGWRLLHAASTYGCILEQTDSGVNLSNGGEGEYVIASQTLSKDKLEGCTSIKVKVWNAVGNNATGMVMFRGEPMTYNENSRLWEWNGEPLTSDTDLSITIDRRRIKEVEVIYD